jgi:hypothetical protein
MNNRNVVVSLSACLLVLGMAPVAQAASGTTPQGITRTFGAASQLHGRGPVTGARHGLGFLPLHPQYYAGAKGRANARAGVGQGSAGGAGSGSATVTTPPNVSPSFAGVFESDLAPPDTTGAIGPTRFIEAINTKFAVFGRTGGLIKSGSLANLTGISSFFYQLSDPQMKYDVRTGRFFYAAVYYDPFFLSDNGLAIGFSKTASPKTARDFCKYYVSYGAELPDYPKLGDSNAFSMVGYNLYTSDETYEGSEVFWLSKPPAGTGCPAASTFKLGFSGFLHNADAGHTLTATPVPADLVDDSNGAGYVVGNADVTVDPYKGGASFLTVFKVTKDASGNAQFGAPIPVTVPTYKMPPNAPEAGSASLLDTLDGRLETAVAAIDPNLGGIALWTAHAVASEDGLRAEERWYEVSPNTGAVLQSGAASDPSLFVWNGAISPDRNGSAATFGGDMAMSVSTSSTSTFPAIQFVWKTGAAAQSALTPVVQSEGPNQDFTCSPCRWGDYSGASADPAATGAVGKVWLSNQWNVASTDSSTPNWRTWIFGVTPT